MLVQITERDIKILGWINNFRYVTAEQVMKKFCMSQSLTYRRLKKLKDGGYLKHVRFFRNRPGVYLCTSDGTAVSDSELSNYNKKIDLSTYEHHLTVIDISLVFEKRGKWITEREIWSEAFNREEGAQPNIHIPDGIIIDGEGRRTAVEVELTSKSEKRLRQIMKAHRRSRMYDDVLYIVKNTGIKEKIERLSGPLKVEVKLLEEVLKDE
jgi:hypothetical protein